MKTQILIPNDQKIISVDELKNWGFSYYRINKLVEAGNLIKLNKKNYENCNYQGENSDFYYAYGYVPSGIICLMSAAVYYNLSTFRPDSIDVAVGKNKKVSTMPDWPTIKLYYFQEARYETGIEIISEGMNRFNIYDIEKTVADIVHYRNKVGIEETKEILTNYLKRSDRDINKLYRYAEKLKCSDIIRTYLEVLI